MGHRYLGTRKTRIAPTAEHLHRFVNSLQAFAGCLCSDRPAYELCREFNVVMMRGRTGSRNCSRSGYSPKRMVGCGWRAVWCRAPGERLPATVAEVRRDLERLQGVSESARVTACLKIIQRRHTEKHFSIADLAAELRYSPSHVTRLLAKETGHGFRWHLSAVRVTHASALLASSAMTIKEVAAAGFSSTSEFDHQFKRFTGVTPLRYRQARPLGMDDDPVPSPAGPGDTIDAGGAMG